MKGWQCLRCGGRDLNGNCWPLFTCNLVIRLGRNHDAAITDPSKLALVKEEHAVKWGNGTLSEPSCTEQF